MMAADRLRAIADRADAEHLRKWLDHHDRAPPDRRDLILAAILCAEPALGEYPAAEAAVGGWASEHWHSDLPLHLAAQLILGTRPVDLCPGLTRAEARDWLAEGGTTPHAEWVLTRARGSDPTLPEGIAVDDVLVARWIVDCWRDPPRRAALTRRREEVVAGIHIEGRYLDRVDELRRADLRQSVIDTFARAAVRLRRRIERALESKGEPLAPAPQWWVPARCARLLLTGPDLVREGRDMVHCVAGYAPAVQRRRSVIVGLHVLGHRSTVELSAAGEVRQHKGPGNQPPHPLCARALRVLHRRWLRRRDAGAGIVEEGRMASSATAGSVLE